MRIQHKNLTIRQAEVTDAKQLAAWWNDGAVMAHAGFPNGLGTTEEEVVKGLRNGLLVVEESDRLIGECNYHNASDGVAEIGIKICETDCQNRGCWQKGFEYADQLAVQKWLCQNHPRYELDEHKSAARLRITWIPQGTNQYRFLERPVWSASIIG